MTMRRRALAQPLPSFGRRARRFMVEPAPSPALTLSDDLKLFAMTFLGGFLFVSVYLA